MITTISIDGNIGSGKSTILEFLKEYFKNNKKIIFLDEPVNEWNNIRDENNVTILEKFYKNQKKYSFAFQMMAFISRLSILKDAIEKNKDEKDIIIITERSLNTDRYIFAKMLYDQGKMEKIEYDIYLKWFDSFSKNSVIQKIIYMKTYPKICFDRVNKRNRIGESNISIEYLIDCNKYHEEMMEKIKDNILVIDSNIDTVINPNINTVWIEKINQFIFEK